MKYNIWNKMLGVEYTHGCEFIRHRFPTVKGPSKFRNKKNQNVICISLIEYLGCTASVKQNTQPILARERIMAS